MGSAGREARGDGEGSGGSCATNLDEVSRSTKAARLRHNRHRLRAYGNQSVRNAREDLSGDVNRLRCEAPKQNLCRLAASHDERRGRRGLDGTFDRRRHSIEEVSGPRHPLARKFPNRQPTVGRDDARSGWPQ